MKFCHVLMTALTAMTVPHLATADVLLVNVTLVDIETGSLDEAPSILIEGDHIAGIGTGLAAPDSVARFDADGGYHIPGLWDSHVHIFSSAT